MMEATSTSETSVNYHTTRRNIPEDSHLHILLNCKETKMLREKSLRKKWLSVNEDLAIKRTINCTKATDLINKILEQPIPV
jgi:hypothetical protein